MAEALDTDIGAARGAGLAAPAGRRWPLGYGMRPATFAVVGAMCAGFQLAMLALLKETTGLGSWSNAVAFVLSAQLNILLNASLTWRDRGRPGLRGFSSRVLQFNALIAVAAVFNQGVYLLADRFVPYLLAGAIGIGATTAAKYLVADRWIFKRPGGASI